MKNGINWLRAVSVATMIAGAPAASAQIEFWEGKVWVTGQERLRLEYRVDNVTFNDDVGPDTDLFLLHRARFGLGVKPVDWFKAFGELQDAREIGSRRVPINFNLEEGALDWRQGWIELANYKGFPLGLKIGRQELSYGDERLIGAFDWNNVGRVFDAVKLRWQVEKIWAELFAGNVVRNNVLTGRDGGFDDKTEWADDFFGLYAQTTICPLHVTEAYVLFRNKDDAVFDGPAREIWTLGARVKSTPKVAPWDYYAEIAGQAGEVDAPGSAGTGPFPARRFGDDSMADSVDHRALAAVVGGGYTFEKCPWKPRAGLEYNYGSGDEDPTDGENNTFDNLYPTNHKFFGYMDRFAWKNMHSPRLTLSAKPHKDLTLQADYHLFWLAEDRDFWYLAGGGPVGAPPRRSLAGTAGSFVGSELDLTFWWNAHKHVRLHGGYAVFFAGDFVDDTAGTGLNGNDTAHFLYVQTTVSF